ncbi:response regulator [Pseudonocardia bannensis]|uniref:Response regulator transcription factor n=1 Tax=Pseudonocardia bannensis TaxID=630973 RepID=A0A848DM80_9PSEU|nr:response regulator transcription factor [Pseudonocardia bannensis]NMH93643.1 response regulator transcription factor [Pseudonocardia bannensis]
MIRVLLVDDHAAVRTGLAALLDAIDDLTIVGTCADGAEVPDAAARLQPHVILMDISMPSVGGIEATAQVLTVLPSVRVVMLTSAVAGRAVHESRAAGAVGYVLKHGSCEEIVEAVRTVAGGGTAWCPKAVEALRHAEPRTA